MKPKACRPTSRAGIRRHPWVVNQSLAATDPRGFLAQYPDGAVIDEAQRAIGRAMDLAFA